MPIYKQLIAIFQAISGKKSFENIVKQGLTVLDEEIIEEIKQYVISRQSSNGGFTDKAGNPDVYYSLFGYLLCQGLDLKMPLHGLREFVRDKTVDKTKDRIDWLCMIILHQQLIADKKELKGFRRELKQMVFHHNDTSESYLSFLGLMAFYYLKDYLSLLTLITSQHQATAHSLAGKPTSILAANMVLSRLSAGDVTGIKQLLMNRFHETGGFLATSSSPLPDLLSTAVALYALMFGNVPLSLVKPACMEYINNLYEHGGFVASELDKDPDIEYTFYGLLALGALSYHNKP